MSSDTVPIVSALLVQLALGLAVFQANARRLSNQCFLLLSIAAALWLTSLYVAASPDSAAIAANAIRQASACGVLILACLNLLRLSITHREEGWRGIFWRSRFWLIGALGMMAFCQTHAFLATALPHFDANEGQFAAPVYGPWAFLYVIYFAAAVLTLTARYVHDLRKTTGGQHAELSFILIGEVLAFFLVLLAFGV